MFFTSVCKLLTMTVGIYFYPVFLCSFAVCGKQRRAQVTFNLHPLLSLHRPLLVSWNMLWSPWAGRTCLRYQSAAETQLCLWRRRPCNVWESCSLWVLISSRTWNYLCFLQTKLTGLSVLELERWIVCLAHFLKYLLFSLITRLNQSATWCRGCGCRV